MKKILNNPVDYVDETLAGLTAAHPEFYRLAGDSGRVVARAGQADARLAVTADGLSGTITAGLTEPVGISVELERFAGTDPAVEPARVKAGVVAASGGIVWRQAAGSNAMLAGIAAEGMLESRMAVVWDSLRPNAASVERLPGSDPTSAALELVRFSSGSFGWNLNDPGHGYTVIRSDRPMDGVAATPLSTGGTWPALLMTDSVDALPEDVLQYLLDVQPGYSTDPTRALYNHVWIIGDEASIGLDQQAEIDRVAELVKVGTSSSGVGG